jgi:hypothetical protein
MDFDALYAQIRELPRGVTGEILEPGVLRTMSRPGRRHRRAAKKGVAHVWLVDPDLRLVEAYETVRGRPLLAQSATDDAEVTLAPFDRAVRLASWWGPDDGA